MEEKISQIQKKFLEKIKVAQTLKELDEIFLGLFGKKGELTLLPREFPKLSDEQRRSVGPLFNSVKQNLEEEIEKRRQEIREEGYKKLETEKFTLQPLRLPVKKRKGLIHPLDQFEQEIVELFAKIGFQQFSDAPEIDTDEYNFELLNIPKDHPARDLQDTLYIATKTQQGKVLLRTQTSNSQVRILRKYKPPIRMMVLGRCFRHENLDARHEHTFDQFELVYVDKNLSMANLQYLSEYFLRHFLGKDIKVRLRPKYYPFVEPGVGIDGLCIFCKGQGCKVCGGVGWLEVGGAGMIHPQILRNGGINPDEYTGIAWGPGLERILMLMHGVNDLRLFRNGNLKFLEQFKK
ncbi:phenylalanine--tRNA ligase subunit alpha [Candidatus Daviesbacteria bacterium]|nr:phenylalanine--tRNA ligase subunit alpha [Candidatus Daviesbacteria bacterium]